MSLFKITNNTTKQLKLSTFKSEKELQSLIEKNLEEIFGIRFIATEVYTGQKHSGRIDTLAIDENNAPVIIEYKWNESENIINQGLFYLDWLVDHKGDFKVLAEKKIGRKIQIDWSQPKLILIASSYNKYDKYAINRMSENIELWSYALYENGIINFEIEGSLKVNGKKGKRITKVKYSDYDLKYHLNKTIKELQDKFMELKEKLLELPDTIENYNQKSGITYKTTKPFTRIEFKKSYIQILLREPKYKDPKRLVRDITTFEWGYKGKVKMETNSDVDCIFDLIKQSYKETL